jgi:hypothetical protein
MAKNNSGKSARVKSSGGGWVPSSSEKGKTYTVGPSVVRGDHPVFRHLASRPAVYANPKEAFKGK